MSNATLTSPSATSLIVRRTYQVPRERVYDAWLDPATIRRFMTPGTVTVGAVTVDPRVGGTYSIVMNSQTHGAMTVRGEYLELTRPERIAFTWRWDETESGEERESHVLIEFFDRAGATELVLTHTQLANEESRDKHADGWTKIADKLQSVL